MSVIGYNDYNGIVITIIIVITTIATMNNRTALNYPTTRFVTDLCAVGRHAKKFRTLVSISARFLSAAYISSTVIHR